ncbi:MAG: hypothetical protein WBP10_07040 [Thermoanaerobaculia bacterium]
MTAIKILAAHAVLYLVTYSVLDFVEDKVTSSGTVAMAILGLSIPLSFLLNLWAVGGLAEVSRRKVVLAAAITGLISPFSAMLWLTLYVNVVGYEKIGSAAEPSNIPLTRTPSIASRNR